MVDIVLLFDKFRLIMDLTTLKKITELLNFDVKLQALDIGCSGYMPTQWSMFRDYIDYIGVDPLINEIDRLKFVYPESRFVAAYLWTPDCKGTFDPEFLDIFNRSSASAEMNNGFNLLKDKFNSGQQVEFATDFLSPSHFFKLFNIQLLDILKIDIDGDDYIILKDILEESGAKFGSPILAYEVEVSLHGQNSDKANTLANVMSLSTKHGYSIYGLTAHKYSRSAYPFPFVYDFPAQTVNGQVLWADTLFIKDAIRETNPIVIKKLIIIYFIYGLYDCVFEALIFHKDKLGLVCDVVQLKSILDLDNPVKAKVENNSFFYEIKRLFHIWKNS